ncbi:MAG: hypothetical protein KDJ77_12165 [Rhodobiaceae bacterium]|nr:hypothetical protein [Rhodobiaceae bacterium]
MTMIRLTALGAALVTASASAAAAATCYSGKDPTGNTAVMVLQVEQFVTFAEISGVYRSSAVGTMKIKADFGSGAGRAYYRHEYESGAVYINFTDVSADYSSYVLDVQGYGRFPFRRISCN